MNLSETVQKRLICPSTKGKLKREGDRFECVGDAHIRYPIVDGVPVLINSRNSLFTIDDFRENRRTTFATNQGKLKKFFGKLTPNISANLKAKENYRKIASILPDDAVILVIGSSIEGQGMEPIYSNDAFEVVGSDVSFGPNTHLIFDAHDIPFEAETFDCVIVQAVMEHVLEPKRVIEEIYRVLKSTGIVYAETPFIQQVHMMEYDFTRFTHLGHRWLFRNFEEIESGPCCGPGMALAWAYTNFLTGFAKSKTIRRVLSLFAALTSFYLKYFDYYLIDKPGSYDAASGFYFLGKKSQTPLTEKELITLFRGVK